VPVGLFCEKCGNISPDPGVLTRLQLAESFLDNPETKQQQFLRSIEMREAALQGDGERNNEWFTSRITRDDQSFYEIRLSFYQTCDEAIPRGVKVTPEKMATLDMRENILAREGGD
jgi:hypothetical protein